jgi:hypothetical protein
LFLVCFCCFCVFIFGCFAAAWEEGRGGKKLALALARVSAGVARVLVRVAVDFDCQIALARLSRVLGRACSAAIHTRHGPSDAEKRKAKRGERSAH